MASRKKRGRDRGPAARLELTTRRSITPVVLVGHIGVTGRTHVRHDGAAIAAMTHRDLDRNGPARMAAHEGAVRLAGIDVGHAITAHAVAAGGLHRATADFVAAGAAITIVIVFVDVLADARADHGAGYRR